MRMSSKKTSLVFLFAIIQILELVWTHYLYKKKNWYEKGVKIIGNFLYMNGNLLLHDILKINLIWMYVLYGITV